MQDCVTHFATRVNTPTALNVVKLGTRKVPMVFSVGVSDMSTKYVSFCTRSAALAMSTQVRKLAKSKSVVGSEHAAVQFWMSEVVMQSLLEKVRSRGSLLDEVRSNLVRLQGVAWK